MATALRTKFVLGTKVLADWKQVGLIGASAASAVGMLASILTGKTFGVLVCAGAEGASLAGLAYARSRRELRQLERGVNLFDSLLGSLGGKLEQLGSSIASLGHTSSGLKVQVEVLTQTTKDLKGELELAEANNRALQQTVLDVQKESSTLHQQNEVLCRVASLFSGLHDDIQQTVAQLQNEGANRMEYGAELGECVARLEGQLQVTQHLTGQFQQLHTDWDSKLEEMRTILKTDGAWRERLKAFVQIEHGLRDAQERLAGVACEYTARCTELKGVEGRLLEATGELNRTGQAIEALQARHAELLQQQEELNRAHQICNNKAQEILTKMEATQSPSDSSRSFFSRIFEATTVE